MRWLCVVALIGCGNREPAQPHEHEDRIAVPLPSQPVAATPTLRAHPPLEPDEGRLAIDEPPPGTRGVESYARIVVTANQGFEINEKAPTNVTLDPTPGVSLAGTRIDHTGERELAFTVALVADRTGDFTIGGHVDFALCKVGAQCRQKTMPVTLQLAAR
jgi:hypothetical protein